MTPTILLQRIRKQRFACCMRGPVTLSFERIAVLVAIYAVLGTVDRVQVMQKYFSPPQDSIMDSTSRWEAQGTV
jgi:hypothetical protein